jgi:hypothetical protein
MSKLKINTKFFSDSSSLKAQAVQKEVPLGGEGLLDSDDEGDTILRNVRN